MFSSTPTSALSSTCEHGQVNHPCRLLLWVHFQPTITGNHWVMRSTVKCSKHHIFILILDLLSFKQGIWLQIPCFSLGKTHGIKTSCIEVDYLVFVVGVIVQSPGVGCHLNRVVICVSQEWLGLLWSLPVDNTQYTPEDRHGAESGVEKNKPTFVCRSGYLPVASDTIRNSQVVQCVVLHSAFNSSHCTHILQYVGDALHVPLYIRWILWCLWKVPVLWCTWCQNLLHSWMEKLPLPK